MAMASLQGKKRVGGYGVGTNFYFRKKTVDVPRLYSIVDKLNDEVKAVLTKHNELLQSARLEMGIENHEEFELRHDFYLPDKHSDFGDIHVGKRSGGWKPLMQANKHFHSIQTLKKWYEQNKNEYDFIDEYDEIVPFGEYLREIYEWNQNPENKRHDFSPGADGFDWTYQEFS
jgi:arsenate reductase-like glutaredoxin family protein